MTNQRQVILDYVNSTCDHLTADEIYVGAKKILPSLALGTVYRNLGILVEKGQIMKVEIPGEPVRYDRNPSPHFHAECEKCGKIVDIHAPELKQTLTNLTGLDITNCSVNVKYICSDCKNRAE